MQARIVIPEKKDIPEVDQDDPEVKIKLSVHVTSAKDEGITSTAQNRISSWSKLLRVTAWVMRWIKIVRKRVNKTNVEEGSPTQLHVLSVEELKAAEVIVIKGYQRLQFNEEFMVLDAVMPIHPHQAGVTHIVKSSPTCQKSCLFTRISTLQAGSSKI